MPEYEVVWKRRKEAIDLVCAVSYPVPDYAVVSSSERLKSGSIIEERSGVFYYRNKRLGKPLLMKSGSDVKINTGYDIRYIGGYSNDGRTVFLDRHFPKKLIVGGKRLNTVAAIAGHHEVVEKWMIDDGYKYAHAHRIATMIERRFVESCGVRWKEYDILVKRHMKSIMKLKLSKSPRGLDLSPYLGDRRALAEIRRSTG